MCEFTQQQKFIKQKLASFAERSNDELSEDQQGLASAMIKPLCTHAKSEQRFPLSIPIIELKKARPLEEP